MRVTRGAIPPGGWHFPVEPEITLHADTHEALAARVFEYRLRHGLPEIDIERAIDQYFCSKWPYHCQKEAADYGHPEVAAAAIPLQVRVARSTAKLASQRPEGGFQLINQVEANARAEICATCPLNVAWRTGCRSCSAPLAAMLVSLRKMRNTPSDASLRGCEQLGVDLQTAVHLPAEVLTNPLPPPANCWRKA